jgi:hypothetical protein
MSAEFFYVVFAILCGCVAGILIMINEKQIAGIGFPVLLMALILASIGVHGYYKMGYGNPISPDKIQNQVYLFSGQVITSKGVVVIIEDTDQNVLAVWQTTDDEKRSLPLPENIQFVKISKDENQTSLVSADIAEKEDNPTSVAKETSQEE